MKSFLRTFLITGVPYGLVMGIYFGVTGDGVLSGVLSGSISGLVFGLLMAWIVRIHENRALGSPPVLVDDEIVRDGRASHTTGRRGQAGMLYLTKKEVLFEAFPPNKPEYRISIPIHDVAELKKRKRLGVFPVLLDVLTKDGSHETFITDDVDDWVDDISKSRESYLETNRPEASRLFG